MKPVKLKFKGINSFSEQTEIDFEKLTKNGIFGIFGDTGSGKSTILDCINFALYGKVERSKEKLDIINYRSDSAEVAFEFYALTEGKRKRYSVERSIKKKSGTHKAALYEDGVCIADNASTATKKITDILGVDAEDFRKCIALPQGEFAQFVKSQPSERIKLIERLFSLYRYGDRLNARLKERESEAELNFRTVSTKLEYFADVSAESITYLEREVSEGKAKKAELETKIQSSEKTVSELRVLGGKFEELKKINASLGELEAEKNKMNELRNGLKNVPVCKAAVETEGEISEKEKRLSELDNELSVIIVKADRESKSAANLNAKAEQNNYDEKIEECVALSAKYQSCEGKPEKLAKLEKELANKRKEYRLKDEELNKLKIIMKSAEEEVEKAEKEFSALGARNFEKLINVDFKGAVLKDEYVNSLDYFVGLNGQVKFHNDDSELYEFISEELNRQIINYRDKVYQLKDFSIENAQKQLKTYLSADEEREMLAKLLNTKTVALKDAQSAVKDCLSEMAVLKRDGGKLSEQFNELKTELVKVFGEIKDFATAVKRNDELLDSLKKQKTKLLAELELTNKKISELSAERAAKETERKALVEEISRLKVKLASLIEQSGYAGFESCKALTEEFSKFKDAETALNDYDLKLLSLKNDKEKLEKVKDINGFSEEALKSAENEKNELTEQLSAERERLAVLEADVKKAKTRLKEKKALQKDLASAEKARNLIAQLKDLTKGNKFMEYLANEYLYDISALASSTLLNLTDGRYFLTYTDNFYAGDNFDCGNLRGVNTLSGGETFLVSLSLALALSQTICSSLKSIEFFFLDEGFGTLDSSLVDTVMNALEKLKSSRFTIGVISHVEELKHRIDNKITVNKATESHGSTVRISC